MLKEDGAIITQKGMSSLFVLVKPSVIKCTIISKALKNAFINFSSLTQCLFFDQFMNTSILPERDDRKYLNGTLRKIDCEMVFTFFGSVL